MPSLSVNAAQKQAFYEAHLAGRQEITTATLSDGTIDSWAVPLSDSDAAAFEGPMQGLGHIVPEVIRVDNGYSINNNNTQAQPVKRSLSETEKESHETFGLKILSNREAFSPWQSVQSPWYQAIVSQPQGYGVPLWESRRLYTYVFENATKPGLGSRAYIFDSGLVLTHPEFASRARVPSSTNPNDYDVQWIFADRDPRESRFTTTWLDPNDPNGPRNPQNGILAAYSDYNGHGTAVSSLVFGDNLGIAPGADVTVVKLVAYTSGPSQGRVISYSVRSALRKTWQDIRDRQSNGETGFVINFSAGVDPALWPTPESRDAYSATWTEILESFETIA